jgi:hypothetical protein
VVHVSPLFETDSPQRRDIGQPPEVVKLGVRKKVRLRKREVVRPALVLLLKVEVFYLEICVSRNWTLVQLHFGPMSVRSDECV